MGKTALLLLDLQKSIIDQCKCDTPDYIARVNKATSTARSASIPVIYVRTCFRRNYPELSSRNFSAARVAANGGYVEGDPSVDFPASITPHADDIVVTKRRVSAFQGSDLEIVLRGLGVDNLVIFGLSTSGAVLSTVRQAADLDFKLTVLADLCCDRNEDVHTMLVEQLFPKQTNVVGVEEWVKTLGKSEQ
jgi:nicotinamidase-related amidase